MISPGKKQKEERGKKTLNNQSIQNDGTWEGNKGKIIHAAK